MKPDDKICYCYDVPYRKLWHFARRHHLSRPSQMSECLGAGTACGWCIPFLKRIFEAASQESPPDAAPPLTAEEYAHARQAYLASGRQPNQF
ncbi:MAG: (2Fe-2S)-binding protein [Phycisphaerae bacterium]|nr:(2Fe-2S)-binding protein [Phycisphaerae bacterium]